MTVVWVEQALCVEHSGIWGWSETPGSPSVTIMLSLQSPSGDPMKERTSERDGRWRVVPRFLMFQVSASVRSLFLSNCFH